MWIWRFYRNFGPKSGIRWYHVRFHIRPDITYKEALNICLEQNPDTIKVTDDEGKLIWKRVLH